MTSRKTAPAAMRFQSGFDARGHRFDSGEEIAMGPDESYRVVKQTSKQQKGMNDEYR